MWRFLRRVLSSRVGLAITAAHLCLVLFDFSGKSVQDFDPQNCTSVSEWDVTGYLIAGRFFHFSYESVLHKLTMHADLPALVLASLLTAPCITFPAHLRLYRFLDYRPYPFGICFVSVAARRLRNRATLRQARGRVTMRPHLTTACTRPATRYLSFTSNGAGGRVMPGVRLLFQ